MSAKQQQNNKPTPCWNITPSGPAIPLTRISRWYKLTKHIVNHMKFSNLRYRKSFHHHGNRKSLTTWNCKITYPYTVFSVQSASGESLASVIMSIHFVPSQFSGIKFAKQIIIVSPITICTQNNVFSLPKILWQIQIIPICVCYLQYEQFLLVIDIYLPQSLMSNADLHPCSWTVWLKTYFCTIPLELSAIDNASDQPTVQNTWELEQPFYIHYKSQHAQIPTHVLLQEQASQNKTSRLTMSVDVVFKMLPSCPVDVCRNIIALRCHAWNIQHLGTSK
jgi:hypothetical protein